MGAIIEQIEGLEAEYGYGRTEFGQMLGFVDGTKGGDPERRRKGDPWNRPPRLGG